MKAGKVPESKPRQTTPPWIWVFLIALTALVSYVVSGRGARLPAQPQVEAGMPVWAIVLLVGGGFVGLVVVLIAVQLYRQYDRDVSRAFRLARAGDKDGAIFELRAALEGSKPSAIRYNGLGALYGFCDRWSEAYKAFLEAEAIGGHLPIYVGNQGIARFKLGKVAEAEPLLAEACSAEPLNSSFACYYGLVLTELGRLDEARIQLEQAEKAYKSIITFPPSAKKPFGEEIDKLRVALAQGKKPAEDLAEL